MKNFIKILICVGLTLGGHSVFAACDGAIDGAGKDFIRVRWDSSDCDLRRSEKVKICWKRAGAFVDTCRNKNIETFGEVGLYSLTGLEDGKEYKIKLYYQKYMHKKWQKFFKSKVSTLNKNGDDSFAINLVQSNGQNGSISVSWKLADKERFSKLSLQVQREVSGLFWSWHGAVGPNQKHEWSTSDTKATINSYCRSTVGGCPRIEAGKSYRVKLMATKKTGGEEKIGSILKVSIPSENLVSDYDVCFYEQINYGGAAWCYREGEMPYVGSPANDKFASVDVLDKDVDLHIYQHSDYQGESRTLSGRVHNLGSFSKKVSSFRIVDRGDGQPETAPAQRFIEAMPAIFIP